MTFTDIRNRMDPTCSTAEPAVETCEYCGQSVEAGWRCECQDAPESPLGNWFCTIVAFYFFIFVAFQVWRAVTAR